MPLFFPWIHTHLLLMFHIFNTLIKHWTWYRNLICHPFSILSLFLLHTEHAMQHIAEKKEKEKENKPNVCFFFSFSLPGAHTLYAILQSLHSVIYLSPLNWNFHLVLAIKLSLFAARSLLMILLSPSLLGFVRSVLSRREKWTQSPCFHCISVFSPRCCYATMWNVGTTWFRSGSTIKSFAVNALMLPLCF